MSIKDKTPFWGYIIALVFILPFFGTGAFTAYLSLKHVAKSVEIASWPEVEAKINYANTRKITEDDSTSHKINAGYSYNYEGKRYTGGKVGIEDKTPFKITLRKRAEKLSEYAKTNKPHPCFVNPGDPNESYLIPGVIWDYILFLSIFTITFGGVGTAGLWFLIFGGKTQKHEELLQERHPDEPWMWKQEWIDKKIRGNVKAAFFTFWAFAILWNAISLPGLFVFFEELQSGNKLIYLILIFPLVGLWLLYLALRQTLRWQRYGKSVFNLETLPGVIGGELKGTVLTKRPIPSGADMKVSLACHQVVNTGDGSSKNLLWQEILEIPQNSMYNSARSGVPISITIPYECQPTSKERRISWSLRLQAKVPGVDYSTNFEVPVFETSGSNPEINQTKITTSEEFNTKLDNIRDSSKIKISNIGGSRVNIEIPPMVVRSPGIVIGLIIFGTIWTGAIFLMINLGAPILFPIVFGLIDLLILLGIFEYLFKSINIEASADALKIKYKRLFFSSDKNIYKDSIVDITFKQTGSSTAGEKESASYSIKVREKEQRKFDRTICSSITDKDEARWIVRELKTALNLE